MIYVAINKMPRIERLYIYFSILCYILNSRLKRLQSRLLMYTILQKGISHEKVNIDIDLLSYAATYGRLAYVGKAWA